MALISVSRTYEDGEILTEADLDAFLDDVEAFLNVTKLNDDNIQDSGINAATKVLNLSVSTSKLAASAVTTSKIADANVTDAKLVFATITVAAFSIDWALGSVFKKSISADATFTFANVQDGKCISIAVENTDSSAHVITMPAGIYWPLGEAVTAIAATASNVYTFIRIDGKTYAAVTEENTVP